MFSTEQAVLFSAVPQEPQDGGDAVINDYLVEFSTDDGATWGPASRSEMGNAYGVFSSPDWYTPFTKLWSIAGLPDDGGYVLRFCAVNAYGAGTPSDSATPVALQPPTMPGSLAQSGVYQNVIWMDWTPSSVDLCCDCPMNQVPRTRLRSFLTMNSNTGTSGTNSGLTLRKTGTFPA